LWQLFLWQKKLPQLFLPQNCGNFIFVKILPQNQHGVFRSNIYCSGNPYWYYVSLVFVSIFVVTKKNDTTFLSQVCANFYFLKYFDTTSNSNEMVKG